MEKSVTDRSPYCVPCRAHEQTLANARRDHQRQVTALINRESEEVANLRAQIEAGQVERAALRRERDELAQAVALNFANELSANLRQLIHSKALAEVESQRSAAYATRDSAMAAVWRIDERHHADAGANEKCSCGEPLKSCRDHKELGFFRSTYYAWERRQRELMEAGKRHGLPRNHPWAILDSSSQGWNWKGAPSTEPERARRSA